MIDGTTQLIFCKFAGFARDWRGGSQPVGLKARDSRKDAEADSVKVRKRYTRHLLTGCAQESFEL